MRTANVWHEVKRVWKSLSDGRRRAIRDAAMRAEDANFRLRCKIVLNLAEVNYIDSSGVGELVSSFTTVAKEGGQLRLLNLTTKIKEILAITRLLTVFQVYDNEQKALSGWLNG